MCVCTYIYCYNICIYLYYARRESCKTNTDPWVTNQHTICVQSNMQGLGSLLWVIMGRGRGCFWFEGLAFMCLLTWGFSLFAYWVFGCHFFQSVFVKKDFVIACLQDQGQLLHLMLQDGTETQRLETWVIQTKNGHSHFWRIRGEPDFPTRHYWLRPEGDMPRLLSHWTRT